MKASQKILFAESQESLSTHSIWLSEVQATPLRRWFKTLESPLKWLPPPMSPGATDFLSDHPVGKGGKGAKCTFHFFPPWFLFTLDLQQVTATVTLQRLQFMVPQQRKEALSFVIKSLPPGAWRYNSTFTLIYFIALFAVFRFNYWLVLLQKGNVLLYQPPGREFSENYRILQREVIIFHFPWTILLQDTSEVCFMHCHRFIGNIKFSRASKFSTQSVPWRGNSYLRYSE